MEIPQLIGDPTFTEDGMTGLPGRQVSDRLTLRQWGPVTLIRLSRPDERNALDAWMMDAIRLVFSSLPEETRAVVLHGAGEHFCAGIDLGELAGRNVTNIMHFSRAVHEALDRIELSPVPVVAALHGAVIGGGLELAAAARIRVAERNAYFALPEAMRGIFVGGGGAVRIPRLIGASRMIDMMLTGRTYKAGQDIGFSQYVVDDEMGLATAIELAERTASNVTMTNFAVVQALPRIARADSETGLLTESLLVAIAAIDVEATARLHDFLEKRGAKVLDPSVVEER
jgi:enoyl-CoA hydratase/carnithine racemase